MTYSYLCCIWTCLSTRSFVCAPRVSVYKTLCFTYSCPSTRAFVLHLDVSVFKSLRCPCACLLTRDLFCTLACLSTGVSAAPGRVRLQEPSKAVLVGANCTFYNFFVLFRLVSKLVCSFRLFLYMFDRYTETNRKIYFLVRETNRKTTETVCVLVVYGSIRKIYFF